MKPRYIDPEFKDRLQTLMREKEKSQSDLARDIFGMTEEARGDQVYKVPKNRQTISKYISGKAYPSEKTKRRLADALGVPFMTLFPNDDPTNRPGSGIVLELLGHQECMLRIRLRVPTVDAERIIQYLKRYAK